MTTEQRKTLEVLKTAIQMEIDGKQFYLKASRQSGNEMGKNLLKTLAAEEDIHRRKFEEIHNVIRNKRGWPKINFQPDGGKTLRTILAKATEEMGAKVKVLSTELEAVQTAIGMENKTYDYYTTREKKATYEPEIEFYEKLASEEQKHKIVLLDYYEFLKDPAGWFVTKEHPSLDGG
jgi:rubrerythrin